MSNSPLRVLPNLKGYYRPKSIAEALALLEKNSGSILVIAGGTKLVLSQNDTVQELVDVTSLNLSYIDSETDVIRIGATTPIQKIIETPALNRQPTSILTKAAQLTNSSRMIRNVSTIGGELVTTHALSMLYCALLVLQAQVRITGGDEFALAMNIFMNKKGLGSGLLIEVLIPNFASGTVAAMATLLPKNQRNPLIGACARLTLRGDVCHDVKIGVTGTGKVPQRLHRSEAQLEGMKLTGATISAVAGHVYDTFTPISDEFASEEYRKEVSRLVVTNALEQCLEAA